MTEKSMHRTLGDFLPAFKQNTNEINEKHQVGAALNWIALQSLQWVHTIYTKYYANRRN